MSWADPEKRKAWQEANAEKRREYNRKWRAEHKDNIREKNRRYRIKHPDVTRAASKRYRLAHREEINAKRREERKKNIPAGDGTITVNLERRDSWLEKAYSGENWLFHAEFGMGYDEMEKYRRIKEYE